MGILEMFTQSFTGYLTNSGIVFLLAAVFGVLYYVSGANDALAESIVERFGSKSVIPSIMLIGVLLTYGGQPAFVSLCLLFPFIISMFKEADIPRYFLPIVYLVGVCIAAIWVPGSSKIGGLLPAAISGMGVRNWSILGILLAVLETVVVLVFLITRINCSRRMGGHYKLTKIDRVIISARMKRDFSYRPGVLTSVLPVIVIVVALKLMKLSLRTALLMGILVACVCFVKALFSSKGWLAAVEILLNAAFNLFCAAVITGIIAVMQLIPVYNTISDFLANFILKH